MFWHEFKIVGNLNECTQNETMRKVIHFIFGSFVGNIHILKMIFFICSSTYSREMDEEGKKSAKKTLGRSLNTTQDMALQFIGMAK